MMPMKSAGFGLDQPPDQVNGGSTPRIGQRADDRHDYFGMRDLRPGGVLDSNFKDPATDLGRAGCV